MPYGIALYQPKGAANWGTLVRTAFNFRADFIATIGHRYKRTGADTVNAPKHMDFHHFETLDEFERWARDMYLPIIAVEVDGGESLTTFEHPEIAVYLFGGEDRSVPAHPTWRRLSVDTNQCLNLAVAGGIVMYDRYAKQMAMVRPILEGVA